MSESISANEERRYRRCYLRSQWALVLITLVGVGIAIFSLHGLKRSIKAANEQARSAATQARIAQQEFEASERPWVGISGTGVNGYPRNSRLSLTFTITNAGKSPASHVWFGQLRLMPFGPKGEGFQIAIECRNEKPTDAGVGVLLLPNIPHHEGPIYSDPLEPNTVEYILEQLGERPKASPPANFNPQGIIFLGCFDYVWNDHYYRTRFCEQYVPVASPQQPYGYFSYCDFNNDTDEDEHCQIHK